MEKTIIICSREQLNEYRKKIQDNLKAGMEKLNELMKASDAVTFFHIIKFEKTVIEPLTGEPENLLEVVNQCQTYLVSIMAVEYLLEKYSGVSFKVNFGNVSGYDIESEDGSIISECFAATSYRSNGKLAADLKRLEKNTEAIHKYEFFYDKEFSDNNKTYYQKKYPDVEIVKFKEIR